MERFTISGASVLAFCAWVRTRGVSLAPELKALGLSERGLGQPDARVELPANHALWAAAAARTGDDALGLHFAERLDLDAFHVLGHLAATSATLGEAFERVVRFSRLLHDAGRTEVEASARSVRVFPGCRGLPEMPPRHVAEFNAASVVVLTRLVTGRPAWRPREVWFHHAAPARVNEHLRVLGVAPRFDAPDTCVVLAPADLRLPVRTNAPSRLAQHLEAYAQERLAKLPTRRDSLAARVERVVAEDLLQVPTLQMAAKHLGLSPRSLQRRLQEESTRYASVVDGVRRRAAERLLRDDSLALAEVAFLLGFRDAGAFHRAFRRWTGKTPGSARQ